MDSKQEGGRGGRDTDGLVFKVSLQYTIFSIL